MSITSVKVSQSQFMNFLDIHETDSQPTSNENKNIDLDLDQNNTQINMSNPTEKRNMPSKKLCAEMFFGDNPSEYDIRVFNILNNYTKKDLITYIIPSFLGSMTTKEYCEENPSKLPKKSNNTNI
jgi:hypothetical protein